MKRREQWRPVLDAEVKRWSEKSCEQLLSELRESLDYEVEYATKRYQVEVELLENTAGYVHVLIAVDDGSVPASFWPLTATIICRKVALGSA